MRIKALQELREWIKAFLFPEFNEERRKLYSGKIVKWWECDDPEEPKGKEKDEDIKY